MKKITTIYQNADHRWEIIARDPEKPDYIIDTNEYIVSSQEDVLLTDPGGVEVFPAVFSALSESYDVSHIKAIFASHQDPDIISSLSLWLEVNPLLKCHISWLWSEFLPHFGGTKETFLTLPDDGTSLTLGNIKLEAIPAHHLHSAGNFHLYDPQAKILFSGDIGAALLPRGHEQLFVNDFKEHIQYAQRFHQRWMGSNEAKKIWCERVRKLDIDMMCPQHGAIYRGDNVTRFIDWFDNLQVGVF